MAISSVELYNDLLFILNKNNSEYISPEEFVKMATKASNDLYNDYLGKRNVRRSVYGHNNITDARLNVFRRKTPSIIYDSATGMIPVPEDCKHIRSITDNFGDALLYQDDNRFYMLKKDSTVDLQRNVYYKEEGDQLETLTDKNISSVVIHYLKKPNTPKLPYTVVDREIVFDTNNVVDLEWEEDEESNLLNRMMIASGIVIKDNTLLQIGRINKSEE